MPSVNGPASVSEVLGQIADATHVLDVADVAVQTSEAAASEQYAWVDRAHGEILQRICTLTDEQADSVEPAVSRLEIRLFQNRMRHQA